MACLVLVAGLVALAGHLILQASFRLGFVYWKLAASYSLLAICYWRLVAYIVNLLLAFGYWQLAIGYGLSPKCKSCTPHKNTQLTHKITSNIAITMAATDALTTIFRHLPGHKILHTHKKSPIL